LPRKRDGDGALDLGLVPAAAPELKPTNILLAPFSVISSTLNFFPRGTTLNVFMPMDMVALPQPTQCTPRCAASLR
jgi:hypothetical protein